MTRLLLAVTLAIGLVAGLSPRLEASEVWCNGDPVEIIITSDTLIVPVFVTSSALGVEHLPAVQLAQISYTTKSQGPNTLVKMTVVVPNDAFGSGYPTATVVTYGPDGTGPILAQATGNAGQPMIMSFTLSGS
jgi:hypothetical protein